jgi:hypothetical protein
MKNNLTKKQKEQLIDDVLDCLDFETIYQTMLHLDWKWRGVLPSKRQIMKMAEKLLYTLLNEESTNISCGGFFADFDGRQLRIAFSVAESDILLSDYFDGWSDKEQEKE